MKLSMTDGGKTYQNAIVERLNGTLKYEFGLKDNLKIMKLYENM